MSWNSCMEKKIEDKWGNAAVECAKDLDKGNLKEAAECIATAGVGVTSGEAYEELAKWSIECAL